MLAIAGGNLPRPTWGRRAGQMLPRRAADVVRRSVILADFQKSDSDLEVLRPISKALVP
jgi:hypothetical protein